MRVTKSFPRLIRKKRHLKKLLSNLGLKGRERMQFFSGTEPLSPVGNRMRCIYIFNRNGVCLLYREWQRPLKTLSPQQDQKLMFGLLFSLKSFTAKMDPVRVVHLSMVNGR
ncbi:Trafficking protein particle complex subunit 1 [Nymphaea thermarum]|nr:Trafficking protein particle complex subunit 1 [Nymphaea thermarum]